MNWHAVQVVAFVVCVLLSVVAISTTMTSIEYDRPGRVAWYAGSTLALFVADALLAGLVWS